jgi:hypothetical protein
MEVAGLTYRGQEITDHEILAETPEAYRSLLHEMNGCVIFNGGLHIRGAVESPDWHSLRHAWRGGLSLAKLFPAMNAADVPFAQDCFGDQFLLRSGLVHRLHAEYGEIESLQMGLETFISRANENPMEFLLLQPLHRFLSEGGELKVGQLLNVYPPFVMKESSQGVSIKAISMFEQISFLADFASQIADVPNGGRIEIKVINLPDS